MNECKRCGKTKSLDNFYKYLHKEARCKSCVSDLRRQKYNENKEVILKAGKKHRDENPEKIRDSKLKQAYGVGNSYFSAKLKEQGGVCAGCKCDVRTVWKGKEVNMALDHDHITKIPRGVLCICCNRALGLLKEDKNTFRNLIDYIDKYKK